MTQGQGPGSGPGSGRATISAKHAGQLGYSRPSGKPGAGGQPFANVQGSAGTGTRDKGRAKARPSHTGGRSRTR